MRGAVAPPAADDDQAPQILFEVRSFADAIAADYEAREFSKAIRQVMFLADRVNQYVDEQKPWEIAKEPGQDAALQWFCTLYLELFRILTIYLKPVLPKVAEDVEAFLGAKPYRLGGRGRTAEARARGAAVPPPGLAHRPQADRAAARAAPRKRRPSRPSRSPARPPNSSWSRSSRPSRP